MCCDRRQTHHSSSNTAAVGKQCKSLPRFAGLLVVVLVVCYVCSDRHQKLGPLVADVLKETPCAAPCWQGIVPGQTTEQEAIDILFSDARPRYIKEPDIYRQDWGMETTIRWLTRGAKVPPALSPPGWWPQSAAPLNTVKIRDGIVDCIDLAFDAGLTAQMVIDKWGNPSRFSAEVYGVEYIVARAGFFYPEQGINFGVYLDPRDDPLVLNPNSQIVGAVFYPPMLLEQWLTSNHSECRGRPDQTRRWPGFGFLD